MGAAPRGFFAGLERPLYGEAVTSEQTPPWPASPAVFLDLDGTLLEIAEHPDAVAPSAELKRVLAKLPAATGGAVAFISGRTVEAVDRVLTPYRFAVAGVHGVQRRSADGRMSHVASSGDWLERVRLRLEQFVDRYPGLLLENKKLSLALHYRGRPDLEKVVQEFVAELELPSEVERLQGRKVVEIKPVNADKGKAIRAYMSEPPFLARTPVFVGDDVTDEAGFCAVNELGGVSVKVGNGPTAAAWTLSSVPHVLAWLNNALDANAQLGGESR